MGKIPVDTANKMLCLVRPIAEDIVKNWEQFENVVENFELTIGDDREEMIVQLQKIMRSLNDNLDELEYAGAMVDNFKVGAIDFPSKVNDLEAMLCWTLGESEVLHYHKPGESTEKRILLKEILE